jgi:hypothetical protein
MEYIPLPKVACHSFGIILEYLHNGSAGIMETLIVRSHLVWNIYADRISRIKSFS